MPPSPSANRFFVGKKLNVDTMLVQMPAAPKACAASSTIGSPMPLQLGHRRRPAEQVHGHDRLRPLRDPVLDVGRVEVERDGVDVGEDRRGAALRDRLGRRVEREGRADHLVARADPERVERQHEGVGAVRAADALGGAEMLRRLALERLDLGPEDEATRVERLRERRLELCAERRVLRRDVDVGDLHDRLMVAAPPRRSRLSRNAATASTTITTTATSTKRKPWSKVSQLAPSAQPIAAKKTHQIPLPIRVSRLYRPKGLSKTPAGIETNERAIGVSAPEEHGPGAPAVEPAFGALDPLRAQMDEPSAPLEERVPAAATEPPAADRAELVAEHAGGDDGEVGAEPGRLPAEDRRAGG